MRWKNQYLTPRKRSAESDGRSLLRLKGWLDNIPSKPFRTGVEQGVP